MSTGYWDDQEREEGTLTDVRGPDDGYYTVTSSNGCSTGVSAEYGVAPKIGDHFVTWGSIGRSVRGQAVNGQVLYYRTPLQQNVEDAKRRDNVKADRIAEYEGKRSDFDARVAALPVFLRERVEGFRTFGGDEWRWSFEPYELMCCEEAAKLYAHFPSPGALKAFSELGYDEQEAAFLQMGEGHSVNSWGFSKRLAYLLMTRPDLVPREHGALCPLAGCEACGCFAGRGAVTP